MADVNVLIQVLGKTGRHSGLMVSVLDSGASGLVSSLGREHCVVFLGKTLLLLWYLSPTRCINGYQRLNAGGNPAMD